MTTDADAPTAGARSTAPPPAAGAPPRTAALGPVLAAIVGAEFVLQLDGTIMAVALPDVQNALGLSTGSLSWVVNGFLLAFGGLLLLGGRLGDVLGYRTTFLAGLALLCGGSLLAGFATDFGVLLAGRVVQGSGAALAGPAGLALLATTFTGARQQRAFATYSTVTGLAASAGMILGGLLTDLASWRWTLLVNAPISLLLGLLALRVLPVVPSGGQRRPLDLPGAALSVVGMTALVFGFVRAADAGWGDPGALVGLAGGAVVLTGFVLRESRAASPLLPLRVLTHRNRAGAFVDLLLMAFTLTSFLFFLTQFLQRVLDLTPLVTGLAFLPFGVALLITARFVPRILTRVNPKTLAIIGFVVMGLAMLWLTRLDDTSGYATDILVPITLLGASAGAAVVPLNLIVLGETAPEEIGVTSAVLQSALSVGGSLGLAVLLTLFTRGDDVAEGVTYAFRGGVGIATAAAVIGILVWYIPLGKSRTTATTATTATATGTHADA
ncbi:MFS transporter [Frankia sp. AgPm24]|uniref:MFS transporter n=1 Tax=Frankia sp. AgPm24 TaxID=631128 RepID=UPI00200C2E6F|nr:MFS transporter [Frankia sp. AgPm24]MCK9925118.1 MFS transporter [Frankia sp. AgPm24]